MLEYVAAFVIFPKGPKLQKGTTICRSFLRFFPKGPKLQKGTTYKYMYYSNIVICIINSIIVL